eukprot:144453-Rhodomonas_salina.1
MAHRRRDIVSVDIDFASRMPFEPVKASPCFGLKSSTSSNASSIEDLCGRWDSLLNSVQVPFLEDLALNTDDELTQVEEQKESRYISAHIKTSVEQQPASHDSTVASRTASDGIDHPPSSQTLSCQVDDSVLLFGLVLIIVIGCGAMHLSLYNPGNFWKTCACVTTAVQKLTEIVRPGTGSSAIGASEKACSVTARTDSSSIKKSFLQPVACSHSQQQRRMATKSDLGLVFPFRLPQCTQCLANLARM